MAMNYQEKCAFIASHAKGKVMTPEEVDAQIQEVLKHPLFALFLDAEDLADATIAQIKRDEALWIHAPIWPRMETK